MNTKRVIEFEVHALHRMLQRGAKFSLNYFETESRVKRVIQHAVKSQKRISKYIVYHRYFNDDLTFYVICKKREFQEIVHIRIITIIIRRGRE